MNIKLTPFFALLFFLSGMAVVSSQKTCPSNFDGKSLVAIKGKIKKHQGETVAFDAEVVEVKQGYNDIPYFKVTLDNGEMLWISSMVSDKYVKPKAKLRLLGYIDLVQKDDAIANKYNYSGFQVRVFAMLDHTTKQMQISNAFENEVKQWVAGSIPDDIR